MPAPGLAAVMACLLAACSSMDGAARRHAAAAAACGARQAHEEHAPAFRLLGEIRWDTGTHYGGVPVGGISGIDWDAARGEYVLISDDRAAHGPARFYTARIRYDGHGLHDAWLTGMHALLTPQNQPYRNARLAQAGTPVPDAEALRVLPGGDALLWASEGDFPRGFGPEINAASHDGKWLWRWPLPMALSQPRAHGGPRAGFTIEGMDFADDGQTLWVSMEGALKQDGGMPSPGRAGAPVRITQFDVRTREPIRQITYQPDALASDIWALPQRAVNGVSEILADGPGHLLVLERSFSVDSGWGARLYRIDTRPHSPRAATDTLHMERLETGGFQPAAKQLLLDFADLGLRSVDNLEGMAWGPRLDSGERVLLLVSDNNFNPAEVTQFIALAESAPCAPE